MTWTKLGDELGDEARDLTDAEFRTHIEALAWSNRRGLDLHVPKRDLRRFAESSASADAADGLAVKGWWEDRGDVWYIGVRFPEWQLERVVLDRRRDDAAQRKRRSRLHKAGDHSLCLPGGPCPHAAHLDAHAQTHAQTHAHVTRDGTRDGTRSTGSGREGLSDLPDPPKNSRAPKRAEYDDAHFGEFWDAYPRKLDKRRAWKAWEAALKRRADPQAIVKAAIGYAGQRLGADERYTKHPATWLNAASYDDEPARALAAERDDDSWMR